MSFPEIAGLKQRAVLWPFTGHDKRGDVTVGSPVEIPIRWESTNQFLKDPLKGPISVTAVAFVDRVIAMESKMWLGKLADLPTNFDLRTASRVVNYDEVPDIKNRKAQRTVMLT